MQINDVNQWTPVLLEFVRSPGWQLAACLMASGFILRTMIDVAMLPLNIRKSRAEVEKLKMEIEVMKCRQRISA